MKKELDEKLCKDYPKIFVNRHGDMRSTLMCWGFAIGDGWFNIIDNACFLIQQHITHSRTQRANALRFNRVLKRALAGDTKGLIWHHTYGDTVNDYTMKYVERDLAEPSFKKVPEACTQVVAVQVKEKFGGLRFYVNGGDDTTDGILRMAEAMSECSCEDCGTPAKKGGSGWITTLCKPCRTKQEKARYASAN